MPPYFIIWLGPSHEGASLLLNLYISHFLIGLRKDSLFHSKIIVFLESDWICRWWICLDVDCLFVLFPSHGTLY